MKIRHNNPLKCSFCEISACYEELPICRNCLHIFQSILTEKCQKCGEPPYNCQCHETVRFMFFFGSYLSRGFMYFIKCNGDKRAIRFLAEIAVKICGINPNSYDAVTYVPRLPRRKRRYGYDPSMLLAKYISEIYGIPFVTTLKRVGGHEQKLLSYSQRMKNIKNRYKPINIPQEKYKRLLLVDDIITTGATAKVCTDIIKSNSAEAVTVLVLAKTAKKR